MSQRKFDYQKRGQVATIFFPLALHIACIKKYDGRLNSTAKPILAAILKNGRQFL